MFLEDRQRLREPFERRLARRLLEAGLVTEAALREALDRQLVHGGHLATALWELGHVGFKRLMDESAQLLGMPALDPRRAQEIPSRVLGAFPAEFAGSRRILPLGVEGRTLHVATCEPWDLPALEEALRASRFRIQAHFLPEVALLRLLEKHYGIPAGPRFRVRKRSPESGATQAPGPELMSEEEFASLYARSAKSAAQSLPGAEAITEPDALEAISIEVQPVEHRALEAIEALDEAQAALDRADSREAVARVMARFALAGAGRVVLLTYEAGAWTGWTGAGKDVDVAAVGRLMVPATEGTIFGIVGQTGAHYLGPLAEHPIHRRFLETLGGTRPPTAGLLPVHYRGRLVYGIYIDTDVDPAHIGSLLVLAQRVPRALERLVQARLAPGQG